jgi:glycerol uptake facilitator-like aquaporin
MGTFILVWTVMMTAVSGKSIAGNLAPIAIGWAVTLAHFVLVPLTGCGINPARSLGPMLVIIFAGEKAGEPGWWIYYTAPFVGSLFAVGVTKYIFGIFDDESVKSDEEIKEEKEEEEVIEKIEAA